MIIGLYDGSTMDGSGTGTITARGVAASIFVEFTKMVERCVYIVSKSDSSKSFDFWGDCIFESWCNESVSMSIAKTTINSSFEIDIIIEAFGGVGGMNALSKATCRKQCKSGNQ